MMRWWWLGLALVSLGAWGEDLHRVVYRDDPSLKRLGREKLEWAYGAPLVVLPVTGIAPDAPRVVSGWVQHIDPREDPKWVVGSEGADPMVRFRKTKRAIERELGLKDIDEKWDEYRFLTATVPAVAPPEMALGSEFSSSEVSAEIHARIQQLLKTHGLEGERHLARDLARLESLRQAIGQRLERAILKIRTANHSEGKLPKSHKDWLELYTLYWKHTRPEIARIQKALEGTTIALQDKIVELPHVEGRVLEELLRKPANVVVQKMVSIRREVRLHVVNGKLLKGATFLRHFALGDFLPEAEREAIERVAVRDFVEPLQKKFGLFSATPDFIIEEGGAIRVLDMNAGVESGYYYPEEDVLTTQKFAEAISGRTPAFLESFLHFSSLPPGPEKLALLKKLHRQVKPFLTTESQESFWNRVWESYRSWLAEAPSAQRLEQVLHELSAAGLKAPSLYVQVLKEVEATFPTAQLSRPRSRLWARWLNALDAEIAVSFDGERFQAQEREELKVERPAAPPAPCTHTLGRLAPR